MKKKSVKRIFIQTAAVLGAAVCVHVVPAMAADGWQQEGGNRYYLVNDQKVTGQWFSVDRTVHYTRKFPSDLVCEDTVVTEWYYAGPNGAVYRNGWYEIDGNYYYFNGNGVNTRKNWINIGDDRYYADENGVRQQNRWFSITGVNSKGIEYTNWYYAGSDGVLYRNGWYEINGKRHYFDSNGYSPRNNWFTVGSERFRAGEDGAVQTGWFTISEVNSNGAEYTNWYCANEHGALYQNGWVMLDGEWYQFDKNGLNYRKRWYTDPQSGAKYYLDESGVMQRDGWFAIRGVNSSGVEYENWYYATEDGSVYTDTLKEIDGKLYKFDANGLMYKKRWITVSDRKRMYADENGMITRNGWFNVVSQDKDGNDVDNWYYANSSGMVLSRDDSYWKTIDGKRYYLNSSGRMTTGWVDDNITYCGEDGTSLSGWQYMQIPDNWISDDEGVRDYVDNHGEMAYFYFSPSDGDKKKARSGNYIVTTIDGKEYCFDDYGIMQLGWVKISSKIPEITGYRYFEDMTEEEDKSTVGQAVVSQWRNMEGPDGTSRWYYFDDEGYPYAAPSGSSYDLRRIHGENYAFDSNGNAATGLLKIGGEYYSFGTGSNGRAGRVGKATITVNDEPYVYYFDSESRGITGIRNGYFYYKGRLQKANRDLKYQVFEVPGAGLRLLNINGKVMKGTTVKDADDQKWVVDSKGEITAFGDNDVVTVADMEAMLQD